MTDGFKSITPDDFLNYWDASPAEADNFIRDFSGCFNFRYREAEKRDLEEYFRYFLTKVTKATARRTVEENAAIFEEGWQWHKKQWLEKGDLSALIPQYHKSIKPYFLGPDGRMYVAEDPALAAKMQILYSRYLAMSRLRDFKTVHEFGSGSGLNLLAMAEAAPDKRYIGYEWTASGVEMANLIGQKTGLNITGRHFDMFQPDYSVDLEGEAVLVYGVIEQLGEKFHDFMNYLISKKPGLVIHLEQAGAEESDDSLHGLLSRFYLEMRGYSPNFFYKLDELRNKGDISVLFSKMMPWATSFAQLRCCIWKL